LGEVELGNGGSVRLRVAAPHPFPALPLGGARWGGSRGSIRWWEAPAGGHGGRPSGVHGEEMAGGGHGEEVVAGRSLRGWRPAAAGRGQGQGPGRRCDDAADDCSCGWGGGSVRRGGEGGSSAMFLKR